MAQTLGSFVGWNPCPEGVVLSGVEGRGSDNMSRTQGSRHGTLVSNLRVGTRKGVPTYGTVRMWDNAVKDIEYQRYFGVIRVDSSVLI